MRTTVTLIYKTRNGNTITGYYKTEGRASLRIDRLQQSGGTVLGKIKGLEPSEYQYYRKNTKNA